MGKESAGQVLVGTDHGPFTELGGRGKPCLVTDMSNALAISAGGHGLRGEPLTGTHRLAVTAVVQKGLQSCPIVDSVSPEVALGSVRKYVLMIQKGFLESFPKEKRSCLDDFAQNVDSS